jgi:transposase
MSKAILAAIIVGIDTHKHTHTAVALTGAGARVGELTIRVGLGGYRELEAWARSLGAVRAFGVAGSGSYGAGQGLRMKPRMFSSHVGCDRTKRNEPRSLLL